MTSPAQDKLMAMPPITRFPPSIAEIDAECLRIEGQHPDWHAWCWLDGVWHARLADGGPKDRVSAPDPAELRKRIREFVPT